MPIRPSKPPSIIAQQPNGAVDDTLLDVVDRKERIWKMATLPARGMRAMHAAIKQDLGITLSSTGRGRTLDGQWDIFGGAHARYRPCTLDEFISNKGQQNELTKQWPAVDRHAVADLLGVVIPESETWTKIEFTTGKVRFPATAAVPGTSPHGLWCADDLAVPDGPDADRNPDGLSDAVVDWLFTHEMDYGFAHSTKSEKWHVQWFVGDLVPPVVLAFETSMGIVAPPVVIAPPLPKGGRPIIAKKAVVAPPPVVVPATPPSLVDSIKIQLEESDMVKAIKAADNEAIFTATGVIAAWVNDLDDYNKAVAAGLAPPMDKIEVVDRSTFSALRLVGALPPGFQISDFQEVIDG